MPATRSCRRTPLFDLLEAEEPDRWTAWDGVTRTRSRPSYRSLVATPLMVDGVLYLSTPLYQAAAIDARTGRTLWVARSPGLRVGNAGDRRLAPPRGRLLGAGRDQARILWGTGDGYLIAVDARTGLPAEDFGDGVDAWI